jgi:adenine deaminase
MAVSFYADVHLPSAIVAQSRLRGVDFITAIEDDMATAEDEEVLSRAHQLRRVVVTQDILFRVMAEEWQRSSTPFSGLVYGHQLRGSIGEYVETLELIAKASEPDEWNGRVEFIPY